MANRLLTLNHDIPLYYHKTDGGAAYLTDTYVQHEKGCKEGLFSESATVIIRIDGDELVLVRIPTEKTDNESSLHGALSMLTRFGTLVKEDICDQDTGWYYRFGTVLETARNLLRKIQKEAGINGKSD